MYKIANTITANKEVNVTKGDIVWDMGLYTYESATQARTRPPRCVGVSPAETNVTAVFFTSPLQRR